MNDGTYIIGLMKSETDALGFIPSTAIRTRWIPKQQYIIAKDARGRRVGYLLHGPMNRGEPCHINQVVLDYDHRRRRHATAAVNEFLARAINAGCDELLLRCAADLQANEFWQWMGFRAYSLESGGKRRSRTIIRYRLPIFPFCTPHVRS